MILKQIGLDNFFDAVSDGNNITHSKPEPEVFLKAAEMLKIAPEDCMIVEDADAGIEAGNTLNYVKKLKDIGTDVECHIFAHGAHGLGLALGNDKISKNVTQWGSLLLNWLRSIGF